MSPVLRRALPLAVALITLTPGDGASHPLHTSLAELTYDSRAREIRVSIRVFIDDLTKASDAYAKSNAVTGSKVEAYARAMFVVVDRTGRPVRLASCGARPVGDLMFFCFRAPSTNRPSGFRIAHRILFDLYADQINLVQSVYDGKKQSLLFVRGDGLKRID